MNVYSRICFTHQNLPWHYIKWLSIWVQSHIFQIWPLCITCAYYFFKQGNWQLGVLLKQANCSNWVSKFSYLISYVGQKKFSKTLPHSLIMEKKGSIMKRNDDKKSLPGHTCKQFKLYFQWNYHIIMCSNKRLANWLNYGTSIQLWLRVIKD